MKYPIALALVLALARLAHAADILGFFPVGGSSHYQPQEALFKALAARGHRVTVVSSFPQKGSSPPANFRDIDVSAARGDARNSLPFVVVAEQLQSSARNFDYIANLSRTYCEIAFARPEVRDLLTDGRHFDLVVTEIFGADCAAGFAWRFGAPLVSVLTSRRTPWALSRLGAPDNPAYMPMMQTPFPPRMGFGQRLVNLFWYAYFSLSYEYRSNTGQTDAISRGFFGPQVPPVAQLVRNTSLVLVNNHHSIDQAHPMVPNYVEIAGIHVKKPKPLPANLKKFMDEAEHGVIYFTLGSLVRVSTLPNETIRAFRDAFAELPQKVLWKFELQLPDVPPNVIISKWFPQTDIFGHPNIKLFISHGGNLGTIEAVHFAVPMVGIPMYFDQHKNIQSYVDKGVAVRLPMTELTKPSILSAVKQVVNDEGYARRMAELSRRFHDRPMSAIDTAVYWTEYVIRHKGAHHLRTAGADLAWYQYHLLDVIAACLAAFCALLVAVWRVAVIVCAGAGRAFAAAKVKIN